MTDQEAGRIGAGLVEAPVSHADLDDLLRHAHERVEVVVYVPRTGRVELAPAPAPGEPVRLYGVRR